MALSIAAPGIDLPAERGLALIRGPCPTKNVLEIAGRQFPLTRAHLADTGQSARLPSGALDRAGISMRLVAAVVLLLLATALPVAAQTENPAPHSGVTAKPTPAAGKFRRPAARTA